MIDNVEELENKIKELEAELSGLKKYGLVWDREIEKEEIVSKCENNVPFLSIKSDFNVLNGKINNLLIEGDNFHSLTVLNYLYRDSVDVIYIDPPYNTGNEDFVYNDKFVNRDDGYRHSKWLNNISKRLILSRKLLKDNGLIFISIDDNEQANLKLLCDSIYGERNFITCFSWMKTATASNLSKTVRTKIEYVLCYKKNNLDFVLNGGSTDGGDIPLLNGANKIAEIHFKKEDVLFKMGDCELHEGQYDKAYLHDNIKIINGRADKDFSLSAQFKWSQATVDNETANGTYFLVKSNKFSMRFQRKEVSVKTPSNLISKDECGVGTNEEGFAMLKEIFGTVPFNYSKPVSLIKYLLNMNPNKDAIILDFYAGSGTTGQAVLELNKEDGGNRKFILCTNNENEICTNITYPRLKTVITGIRDDGTKFSDGISGNLYYFKDEFLAESFNDEQTKYNLAEKADGLLCIVEDCYEKVDFDVYFSHYKNNDKHLFIYNELYNAEKFENFKSKVLKTSGNRVVYIYTNDYVINEKYFDDAAIIVKPMPMKIFEIYKEISEKVKRGEL